MKNRSSRIAASFLVLLVAPAAAAAGCAMPSGPGSEGNEALGSAVEASHHTLPPPGDSRYNPMCTAVANYTMHSCAWPSSEAGACGADEYTFDAAASVCGGQVAHFEYACNDIGHRGHRWTATFGCCPNAPADLLGWPDCPPGLPYSFAPGSCIDSIDGDQECSGVPASFVDSSDKGPSGSGACSLDVTSGTIVVTDAGTSGGVAFATPGEQEGVTYTLAFDIKFVQGADPWIFANETGSGDTNALTFRVPYPGDNCWHRCAFTANIGPTLPPFCGVDDDGNPFCGPAGSGPKPTLFVAPETDGVHEMRIDNMTLRLAVPGTPIGLHCI